jgi:quercetin dioxygenase-like cupin family protein
MRSSTAVGAAVVVSWLAAAGPALAQAPAHAKPDELLKEVVGGMPRGERQEVRIYTATLKPGDTTPFHTHRFPVAAYVVEGAFTLEMEGRPPVVVKAGEAILEPPNVRMTGFNRASENTRIVIFYVADPGTPFLDMAHH